MQSGQIDAAVSSITITKKRLESVAFAQPYYDSDQSLAVRSNSDVKDLGTMSGKVVAVDTGSTGDMWTTQNKDKYKFSDIRRYEGLSPAMLDLASGRIDGYISDIPAVQYYIKDKPAYKVVERIPTGEQYSIMFAKNSPLAREGQRRDHQAEAGRHPGQDPREVVRRQGRAELDDRQGHGDAEALSTAARNAGPRRVDPRPARVVPQRAFPSCQSSTPS